MIAAVVLAAGRSRRMGAPKLLLPLGGRPLIARVVDEVLRSRTDQVFVVTGPEAAALHDALAGRRVNWVHNPDPSGPMLASIRCGLAAVPSHCSAVLVVLGDQPGVDAGVITALIDRFQVGDRGILVPTWGGHRGHPLLFAAHYRSEVMKRFGEAGLRGLLQAHPQDVLEVPVASAAVLEDVDVPADYRRAAAQFAVEGGRQVHPGPAPRTASAGEAADGAEHPRS